MTKRLITAKDKELLKMLEKDLQGEYDTINLYNNHIEKITIPEIKNMLIHIRDEEVEHVSELKELLEKYK